MSEPENQSSGCLDHVMTMVAIVSALVIVACCIIYAGEHYFIHPVPPPAQVEKDAEQTVQPEQQPATQVPQANPSPLSTEQTVQPLAKAKPRMVPNRTVVAKPVADACNDNDTDDCDHPTSPPPRRRPYIGPPSYDEEGYRVIPFDPTDPGCPESDEMVLEARQATPTPSEQRPTYIGPVP